MGKEQATMGKYREVLSYKECICETMIHTYQYDSDKPPIAATRVCPFQFPFLKLRSFLRG